jgi:hypothetical protein
MTRPDQERFDQFALQVTVLDGAIERFSRANGFHLEVNAYRTPSRVLRRQADTLEIIDIYLDGDWKCIEYNERLPCIFSIGSYFESSPEEVYRLYRICKTLANEASFSSMASRIDALLQQALEAFNDWKPELIMAKGEAIENLKRKHDQRELGE